jgi:hypothetical protein
LRRTGFDQLRRVVQAGDPWQRPDPQPIGQLVPGPLEHGRAEQVDPGRDVQPDVQQHPGVTGIDEHLGGADHPHPAEEPDGRHPRTAPCV